MTSSFTARNRLLKQGAGDNTNTWGDLQSAQDFDMIDQALDGWATIPLTGNLTLSSANGLADQARMRMLKFTGTGAFTVTTPAVSKFYLVWNAGSGPLTFGNGSAAVTLQPAEVAGVINDGAGNIARVQPTDYGGARITGLGAPSAGADAATKGYVDAQAFSAAAGNLPGQPGNGGKFLTTDGTIASWGTAVAASRQVVGGGLASGGGDLSADRTITVTAATASDVRAGSDTSKAVTASALMASSAFQTLTDAATITWNCANGYNAAVTLTASGHTVGAPTGLYDGLCVSLEIVQDATGNRTVSWNAIWDFGAAGLPTLQTAAAKADLVFGIYRSRTGKIHASFRKGA